MRGVAAIGYNPTAPAFGEKPAEAARGPASDRNCPPASTICLAIANRSKIERVRRSICVAVTTTPGSDGFEQLQQFAPVRPRAAGLLAENPGAAVPAQLRKLGVEYLSIGADATVAEPTNIDL